MRRTAGLTLLEVLVALGLVLLGLLLSGRVAGVARHTAEVQFARDQMAQEALIAQNVLQNTLRHAGYRGGGPSVFVGQGFSPEERARVLLWVLDHWKDMVPVGLQVQTGPAGDQVQVAGLERIEPTGSPGQYRIFLFKTAFSRSASRSLLWNRQDRWCDVNVQSHLVQCQEGASNPQPVVEHLEAFEVFTSDAMGTWSAVPSGSRDIQTVGIYMRFRYPVQGLKNCGLYPTREAGLPAAPQQLGISSQNIRGTACEARRLEVVQVVQVPGVQEDRK